MTEKESEILLNKADEIVKKLTVTLYKEVGDEISPALMMYVAAKLSAGIMLSLQQGCEQPRMADDFNLVVKKLMKIMKTEMATSDMGDKDDVN